MARAPVGVLVSVLLASCGPSKTVPQGQAIVDRLEKALQDERPNTVLSTDAGGDNVERYVLDERELVLYASFAAYVVLNAKEEGCRNVSAHCVRCPRGRTYCTNASQLLTPPGQGP